MDGYDVAGSGAGAVARHEASGVGSGATGWAGRTSASPERLVGSAVGTSAPVLVACAHGTGNARGARAIEALVASVARRAGVPVCAAYVDVQNPSPQEALAAIGAPAVLVPVLLSAGYHVQVDLGRAARGAESPTVVADPMGPDDRLLAPLLLRLSEQAPQAAAARAGAGVVGSGGSAAAGIDDVRLVAAGSSRARSAADVAEMARRLGRALGRDVREAYLSADEPLLTAVVAANRAVGRRTVAVSYLLAPGHFQDRLEACGADVVTAPLLAPDAEAPGELVEVLLARYVEAAARLA